MNCSEENLATAALEAALGAGADAAESFMSRSSSTTVEVSGGQVENVKVRDGSGVGVRVLRSDRLGFAHTSDLSPSGLRDVAKQALANAESGHPDPCNTLPLPFPEYPKVARFDPDLAMVGVDQRIERALQMESAARAYDRRVDKVRHSTVSDASFEAFLVNSRGVSVWHKGTSCQASIIAVAEANGDAQYGWEFDHSFYFKELEVERVGRVAARRAVELLGARQIETTTVPVILDSSVASEFLGAIGHALMADQVQKRKSFLLDKVGQRVGSLNVTIIDDGAFPTGFAPSPCDGEGVPSRRTVVVESGVLREFLHNTYTAVKWGVESTGNGMRSSYSSMPEVGASNLYFVPGTISREDLIAGCSRAYLVMDVMGMHTVDSVSGDFSVGANGLWIEGGKVTFPVRETTIAGNVKDILMNTVAVADDLRFYSRYGSPTILVKDVVVSGK
ncbi:MAG: TldD/PmbA family protein [Candidatus Abyssubacteria bacterium]